jgi:protease-4
MRKFFKILVILLLFLPGCVFVELPGIRPLTEKVIDGEGRDKIAVIEISGVITPDNHFDPLGFRPTRPITARIKEELKLASEDKSVKAIILRINSPGGSVTTCDIISHEIKEFRKKSKVKVVAQFMDVSASGAYYIAASADKIVAHPTSITGSIGVVAFFLDASGLMKKVGIADQTVKSGEKKDIGSPLRSMTPEEREILQAVIDSLYERFLDAVVEGRPGVVKGELRKVADGRIYTAKEAIEYGLIDEIGYLDDSIELAKELAGIEEARIVTYAPRRSYKNNIYSAAELKAPSTVNLLNIDVGSLARAGGPQFMYLWTP